MTEEAGELVVEPSGLPGGILKDMAISLSREVTGAMIIIQAVYRAVIVTITVEEAVGDIFATSHLIT